MAEVRHEGAEVNARIVYWGVEGAGKSTNLATIRDKLRPDHRGDLRQVPTRLDPSVHYDLLPIELGDIAGVRTRIEVIAVPGGPDHGPTRKQLLDQVDGIVFVVDPEPDRLDANAASLEELKSALASYGTSLDHVPLVVQYNKRDLADPFALESLHRKLDTRGAAAFEAVATDGTAVLQTLTTISKRVIRALREREQAGEAERSRPAGDAGAQRGEAERSPTAEEAVAEPVAVERAPKPQPTLEERILEDEPHPDLDTIDEAVSAAEAAFDPTFEPMLEVDPEVGDLHIASVGRATRSGDRAVRVPLVLRDDKGSEHPVALVICLETAADED